MRRRPTEAEATDAPPGAQDGEQARHRMHCSVLPARLTRRLAGAAVIGGQGGVRGGMRLHLRSMFQVSLTLTQAIALLRTRRDHA
ncbi:hypothetical protein JCM18899A_11510 [Nocardioides sp. AN3]